MKSEAKSERKRWMWIVEDVSQEGYIENNRWERERAEGARDEAGWIPCDVRILHLPLS
jgi:hypothetical protein